MKKISLFVAPALLRLVCNEAGKSVFVMISNAAPLERDGGMVEVSMSEVPSRLQLFDIAQVVVVDTKGQQVPYQITSDEKVTFPASVQANDLTAYTTKAGIPQGCLVKACGRYYPEWTDDVAWGSDLVAFRTYGPVLQETGERAFGYDIWTKYNAVGPVAETRYEGELGPDTKAKVTELGETGPEVTQEPYRSVSCHMDHGNGLGCYKVGPTLGGGTAALMADDAIIYLYCYATQKVLDNGSLRSTVGLVYHPLVVRGDPGVIEACVITLDVGSHLDRAIVSYTNLRETIPLAIGIAPYEPNGTVVVNTAEGYITYVDPMDSAGNDGDKTFVSVTFLTLMKEVRPALFPGKEKEGLHEGIDGHVLAISEHEPEADFIYYWGAAWDKADIEDAAAWNVCMVDFVRRTRNPLTITVK